MRKKKKLKTRETFSKSIVGKRKILSEKAFFLLINYFGNRNAKSNTEIALLIILLFLYYKC